MAKSVQEQFGEAVISAIADFARQDIKTAADYESDEFKHITDPAFRRNLAQVFYGARWIYKLGLALLVRNEERAAHVRAQLLDYAAVVEGLLSDCVAHGVRQGHTTGTAYLADAYKKPINWSTVKDIDGRVIKQNFFWLSRVASEFGVFPASLLSEVDWLRNERNTVHIRKRASVGAVAYLNESRRAFELVCALLGHTRAWKALHP